MNHIIECVPNFSEGRDYETIERIVECFRGRKGVKLLDYTNDENHNRLIVTVVGERNPLRDAVLDAFGVAISLIDLNNHAGAYPRMGAVDVVPFTPLRNATMEECVELSREVGAKIADLYNVPVFLYDKSATCSCRENLHDIRQGEFEGMLEKLSIETWRPDYGPCRPHPTAGVVAVGARMPIVSFNINLNTDRIDIAQEISSKIGYMGGSECQSVRAMGVRRADCGAVQVSVSMTEFLGTALYRVFETVRFEAMRWGVSITGSEIVGLVPMATLAETAEYYLGIENFSISKVLEARLMDE